MNDKREPSPRLDRRNRAGCFIVAGLVLLILAALAFVGLQSGPTNETNTVIPTLVE